MKKETEYGAFVVRGGAAARVGGEELVTIFWRRAMAMLSFPP